MQTKLYKHFSGDCCLPITAREAHPWLSPIEDQNQASVSSGLSTGCAMSHPHCCGSNELGSVDGHITPSCLLSGSKGLPDKEGACHHWKYSSQLDEHFEGHCWGVSITLQDSMTPGLSGLCYVRCGLRTSGVIWELGRDRHGIAGDSDACPWFRSTVLRYLRGGREKIFWSLSSVRYHFLISSKTVDGELREKKGIIPTLPLIQAQNF